MLPAIAGGLVAGGMNLIGDIVSQTNARSAFQSRYQDTVKDMRAAGLNPALAYGQGGGNPQTSDFGDTGSTVVQGANNAAQSRLTSAQAKLLEAQTNDLVQTTAFNRARANFEQQNADTRGKILANQQWRREVTDQDYKTRYRTGTQLMGLQVPSAKAYADFYSSRYGRMEPYIDSARGIINTGTDVAKAIRGGGKNNGPLDYEDRTASGKGFKTTRRSYQRR